MTNIEQFTRELMLAHDIDYKTALSRAEQFYDMLDTDRPEVLNDESERAIVFTPNGKIFRLTRHDKK